MFKIGEFSRLSNITVRSLRHYEGIGLMPPEKTDPATGYRYYSDSQLETANKIRMFRDAGFSLAAIKGLLRAGSPETERRYYELRHTEIEEELRSLGQKKDVIRLLLEDGETEFEQNEQLEENVEGGGGDVEDAIPQSGQQKNTRNR
ncbi:MAG: helix-turn-helix domain-containing protein [Spirochaetaceae bacterium]|jgi:DNA-binding transcriptional MerR regulator|nr:helix-turn-helix domain-containing protein [Spirochaetaceae bacterium]